MIRPITIVGTVALAMLAGIGCDRPRHDTPSSTTNTTSADGVRDLDKNGVNDTRLDDKGVVANQARTEKNELRDDTRVGPDTRYGTTTTTGATTDRINENTAEARREMADDKADFMKKRADFKASVVSDLADADKRIAKLEERLTTEKDATDRARIQRALPTLKAKRDAVKRSLDSVDGSTVATWDTTKSRISSGWNDLKSALDDAAH